MEDPIHDPPHSSTVGLAWCARIIKLSISMECSRSEKKWFSCFKNRVAEPVKPMPLPEPEKPAFSVSTSSKGGIDIMIGSKTIHVRMYVSAHHPLVQMLLFAEQLSGDTFEIPETMIGMFKKLRSSTSPNMYEAGWPPAKACNAATPEDTTVGSNGRRSEASLPVLKLCDGNFSDPNAIVAGINMDSMITAIGCDLTVFAPEESLHQQNYLIRASLSNTSIICSVHKDDHEIRESKQKNHSATDSGVIEEEDGTAPTWLVASAAPHHATGNRGILSDFTPEHYIFVQAGDGEPMQVCGRGSVISDAVVLPDVLFVPGLTNNLVSASQLTELDYCIGFARSSCTIRRMNDSMIVGKASLGEDGLFKLDYLKVPLVI